jgi:hypothetical protein
VPGGDQGAFESVLRVDGDQRHREAVMADVVAFRFRLDAFGTLAKQIAQLIGYMNRPAALYLLPKGRILVLDANQPKQGDPAWLVGTYAPGTDAVVIHRDMRTEASLMPWTP